MSIVYETPAELIAALRATADDAERNMGDNITAVRLGGCIKGMRQAATMLQTLTRPEHRFVVTDQLAQRLAERFWQIIQDQRHGADIGASLLAAGNHGGGWEYFKRALEEALAEQPKAPQWSQG